MKGNSVLYRVLVTILCLTMMLSLLPAVQAVAAENVHINTQAQDGNQDGLILVLSAVAITGLVLLIAIRWGKKKFFEN